LIRALLLVIAAAIPCFVFAEEGYWPPVEADDIHVLAWRFDTFASAPDDELARVAYGTAEGKLVVLQNKNDHYEEMWRSSELVTRVKEVQIDYVVDDSTLSVIAYNTRGTLFVFDLDRQRLMWRTHEARFSSIEAMTLANVDSDEQMEIIFLASGKLYIFDGRDYVEEWSSTQIFDAKDVVAGDVDGDGQAEIVLSTGHVLDGATRGLEWESTQEFGDCLRLADVDGDGRLEVIAGSEKATTIWDIDERRQKWD